MDENIQEVLQNPDYFSNKSTIFEILRNKKCSLKKEKEMSSGPQESKKKETSSGQGLDLAMFLIRTYCVYASYVIMRFQ